MNTISRIFQGLSLLVAGAVVPLFAQAPNTFLVHNLVSDQAGMADVQDPNLVNPWGNGFGSTPFWIGDQGSGVSTLYNGYGTITPLVVTIPQAGNMFTKLGFTGPTGVIFNSSAAASPTSFVVNGGPPNFMFCTLDGVLAGWYSKQSNTSLAAAIYTSPAGVYTGCVLGGTAAAPVVLATNFYSGNIDVISGSGALVPNTGGAWSDSAVPSGFAPYNIRLLNGNYYVTYWAKSSAGLPAPGPGSGYVAVFSPTGTLVNTLIAGGAGSKLNLPYGLAIAPSNFGPFGGDLLVGNFTDGTINVYNATSGAYVSTLDSPSGSPIALPGLWSIDFGSGAQSEDPGTLYFTEGVSPLSATTGEPTHGLLGSIQAIPSFTAATVESAASFLSGPITANEWVTITGSGLSATTGVWKVTGTQLPTTLNGVSVTVNGEAAPVSFVGNTQINFLVPADIQAGTTPQIQITNNGLPSASVSVTAQPMAPAFFIVGTNATTGAHYVAATHANGSLIGPSTITGATPAEPGEVISLFGTGFGPASSAIPNGQAITSPLTLPVAPLISIDGLLAVGQFAGVVGPGLYQFNVVVPQGAQRGADALAVALIGDTESQPGAFITIAAQ
jgi:uncharacterized protein (TIGR03118 family)